MIFFFFDFKLIFDFKNQTFKNYLKINFIKYVFLKLKFLVTLSLKIK